MKHIDLPVNLAILQLTPARTQALKQTRVLDIFDGGTTNFHEEGLFSISTFGRVGSDERDTRFSFIDVRVEIFHPYIYKQLCLLKALYKGIMSGRAYATWDPALADFVTADETTGETGYHFFMSHWRDIVLKPTGSDVRDLRIKFITKYRDAATTTRVLVIPAGLRDVQIDETGRVKEGEINEFYRALISISNTINTSVVGSSSILDTSRQSLQTAFNNVYEYLSNMLEGKGGFFQAKWGSRRVFNGTRNVFTSMDTSPAVMGASNSPKINSTGVGLYQILKGVLPLAKHYILNGWLQQVFNTAEGNATLVNTASLKRETVKVSTKTVDRWMTTAGIEKVINSYMEVHGRLEPIIIEDYYLGLVYLGDGTFRIFNDIDDLPKGDAYSRDNVHPLTLCELLYLSGYRHWNKLAMYVTRYPIAGNGSIYPSHPYVKNTVRGVVRYELDDAWAVIGETHKADEYPVFKDPVFVDSLIPHPSRLAAMAADFDGDTGSANFVYSDEAVAEIHSNLKLASTYVNPRGGLLASPCVETVDRMLITMTRP